MSQTSEDTTTSPRPRQKWNIKDKENIQEVKLKYNYERIGNTDVGSGNANDGYADYYMNIFGDIKSAFFCFYFKERGPSLVLLFTFAVYSWVTIIQTINDNIFISLQYSWFGHTLG